MTNTKWKLSHSGHCGGRYGALTREEIEGVIAQIDEALGTANETAGSLTDPPEAKE